MKKLNKKDYIYIGICFTFCIAFILFLLFKGYLFGSNTDWENQHIIIPEFFRTLFYNNGKLIPSFAFNLGMGQNIFYFSYYGLLSPLILLSYLLPNIPMYIYIPIISILMLLLSIYMFYGFINDKYNSKVAFIASIIFTLAGPIIYHSHRHIMFVIYMPFLIGALKSIDYYFNKKDSIPLIIYTFLMIMTSYYYSIPGIIVIGIYTIYKILQENKKIKWQSFIPLRNVIFFVIISILLSAILLIPTAYTLTSGRLDTNNTVSILQMFIPKITYKLNFYYSYSLGLTFIYVVSLINALISKKKENIFTSIVLLLCILFPIFSFILNGFMYVDGKCFIPFLPIAILMISEFLNDLFNKKVKIKKLMYILIPIIVFMLYCAIGYTDAKLLILDILLISCGLLLVKKLNKPNILIIPIVLISLLSFWKINENENYITLNDIKAQNNEAYSDLSKTINDTNVYRTANNDMILNNVNKVYNASELLTTMYSSAANNNYVNFMHNVFENEIINKDNITITQTSNVLFNIYSGTKYLITKESPLKGYNKVQSENNITLYKNDDVLPLGYATTKVMSLREFQTLKYPETIDALLNYVIVNKSLENVYVSNVHNYDGTYTLENANNITINNENNHYIINANNNSSLKIKLNEEITNDVLIIKFNMNKAKEGNGCSTNITINNITNALSCTNWKYNNNNNTFEYVISSNDPINTLDVNFTSGIYDINDIELYTINYNQVKNIKNTIDEFVIDQNNTTDNYITGTIDVMEDGFFKLTIPYESKGFKAYIDGKRVGINKVDTAFIGFAITKGEHTITIKYKTPYLKTGLIVSAIGLVLLLMVIFYKRIKKPLNKVKEFIIKYLKWVFIKIKKIFKENKPYILLFISLFMLDLALRIFYSKSVDFYHWYSFVPNMFSIIWILLILNITKILKKPWGNIFYLVCYIFSLIMFLVHAIYFSYFNLFFDYSVLGVASEGTEYYETVLLNIKYWVVIITLISIYLTIRGLKKSDHFKKFPLTRFLIIIAAFVLIHMGLPMFLGSKNSNIEWDEWRNYRSIYESFNDNNKSMMVGGMYEYNIRNFYVNYMKDNSKLTIKEQAALKENFKENTENTENKYTGAFKNKNLIIVQMESIDEFLLDKDIMPTLYKISKNSINFTNHYSFTSGGGSTFNSEFMVNTGYSTAYNTNENAYLFSRNTYSASLPNLLKKEGYIANAFHMNSAEYYSRGVNYKAFGYDNYYSLKDQGTYKNNEYWLDRELINNKIFNEKIFKNSGLSLSYIITYTAHMPYKTTKGTCGMLTDEEGLTEFECLKIQAKETDDAIELLFDNLEKNQMLDNTIVVLFADHYIYTLEDKTLLDRYKETDNNLINHTPFMIWSNGQIKKTVTNVNSQLDILPTLLNLFGITYKTNNYIGRDILDTNYDPLVFFSDGSWYNGKTYVANGEYQTGKTISDDTLNKYNTLVKRKMLLNDAILKSDYFANK